LIFVHIFQKILYILVSSYEYDSTIVKKTSKMYIVSVENSISAGEKNDQVSNWQPSA
jgi:hypothetical protein